MLKMKKQIIISLGILLVLSLPLLVSSFEFNEDEQGNAFYEADAQMKAPSISIRDLFIYGNCNGCLVLDHFHLGKIMVCFKYRMDSWIDLMDS